MYYCVVVKRVLGKARIPVTDKIYIYAPSLANLETQVHNRYSCCPDQHAKIVKLLLREDIDG